jgi:hypothetical protein
LKADNPEPHIWPHQSDTWGQSLEPVRQYTYDPNSAGTEITHTSAETGGDSSDELSSSDEKYHPTYELKRVSPFG